MAGARGLLSRFDIDSGIVSHALAWCMAQADPETGLRICTAVCPRWVVQGTFAEGSEWLDSFLALDTSAVSSRVRGAALVSRAQLTLASDPAGAKTLAGGGLEVCREAGDGFWTAVALNLLSETAVQTGRIREATARADQAMAIAQRAGDRWNEGYALGTRAMIGARTGKLREAEQLAELPRVFGQPLRSLRATWYRRE